MELSQQIKNVIVDPRCKFNYASYFLEGLNSLKVEWRFSFDDSFRDLMKCWADYRRGFCMLFLMQDNSKIKVYIDDHDANDIDQKAYDWCDVYATVNIDRTLIKEKILPLGPTCGLKVFSPLKTTFLMLTNYLSICRAKVYNPGLKNLLNDYLYTIIRRLRYSDYSKSTLSQKDYCFALSTLWYDDITDKETNNWRYVFTKTCKSIFPVFEGGFFLIKGAEAEWPKYKTYTEKYKGLIFDKRMPLMQYLDKTMRSALVFNTPSVQLCLGWKLAEYLMMGKAIISTEITNVMPGVFRPGEHYLLVHNEHEMVEMIKLLREDDSLRGKLENNAKQYFEEYLTPSKMIERIIQFDLNKRTRS